MKKKGKVTPLPPEEERVDCAQTTYRPETPQLRAPLRKMTVLELQNSFKEEVQRLREKVYMTESCCQGLEWQVKQLQEALAGYL